jgi:hypothetical protein
MWARNSARKRWAPIAKPTGGENQCRKISSGHRSQSPSRRTNRGESASTAESSLGRANHGKWSRVSPGIETRATETAGKNPKRSRPKCVLRKNACLTHGGKKSHENNGKTKIKIWIWTRVTKSQCRTWFSLGESKNQKAWTADRGTQCWVWDFYVRRKSSSGISWWGLLRNQKNKKTDRGTLFSRGDGNQKRDRWTNSNWDQGNNKCELQEKRTDMIRLKGKPTAQTRYKTQFFH